MNIHTDNGQSNVDMGAAALELAAMGWPVFPCHGIRAGKCTCGGKADCTPGKHPITRHGRNEHSTDKIKVAAWWKIYPWANIGVATGPDTGLLMIGPDGEQGRRDLEDLEAKYGAIPHTPMAQSGSNPPGCHLYFRYPKEAGKIPLRRNHRGTKIDVRGQGGLFIAAPSLHLSGNRYSWVVHPSGTPLADCPQWLVDWAKDDGKPKPPPPSSNGTHANGQAGDVVKRCRAYVSKLPAAISGQNGHATTFLVASYIFRGFALSEKEGWDVLTDYNSRCVPPWGEKELRHKMESAIDKGEMEMGCKRDSISPNQAELEWADEWQRQQRDNWKQSLKESVADLSPPEKSDSIPLTDVGNGQRLIQQFGRRLRHAHPWKKWLEFNGRRWKLDDVGQLPALAKHTIAQLYAWARGKIAALEAEMEKELPI